MRILAIVKRIFQQLKRDKRTLALLFLAPLVVLSLMYFIFDSEPTQPSLVVTNASPEVIQQLEKTKLTIIEKDVYSTEKLQEDEYGGWLDVKTTTVSLLNEDPAFSKVIQQSLATLGSQQSTTSSNFEINYIFGDYQTNIFDIFSPMLIGFFVFFFVFLIAGIALLKERTSGTLERLLATPIKRIEIIAGYIIGYGIFAIIQTTIIVLFSIYVLDIVSNGSIWLVLLVCSCTALVALSVGTFLSSFANSEFQMVQFIPLIIIPQVFFSGIFPLESMANWLQGIGYIMPLYYAADALNGVMYKGLGFTDIALNLGILILFASVFLLLNQLSLRKYRRI